MKEASEVKNNCSEPQGLPNNVFLLFEFQQRLCLFFVVSEILTAASEPGVQKCYWGNVTLQNTSHKPEP